MVKLQKNKRTNGSVISSVNIPLSVIDETKWNKGDEINVIAKKKPNGVHYIVIERTSDDIGFY